MIACVDPATCTGLALISNDGVYLAHCTVEFGTVRRDKWLEHAQTAMASLIASAGPAIAAQGVDKDEPIVWAIEDWARHLSYATAVRLAHVQQVWVDVAGLFNESVTLLEVTGWQASAGVTKASRAAGVGDPYKDARREAGKAAAALYARAAIRNVPAVLPEDVTDALAMGAVFRARKLGVVSAEGISVGKSRNKKPSKKAPRASKGKRQKT